MNVKDRRVDLRWKMANKEPWEIEEVCKTILQEREKIMQEKTHQLVDNLKDVLPNGYEKFKNIAPEIYEKFLKAYETYNAQAVRWVLDECSPVEWIDSDAYIAAAQCGQCAMDLATVEIC